MMQILARLCATLCAAVGLVAAPAVHAANYALFDLGTLGPPPGPGQWNRMEATGLNNSGQAVGFQTHLTQATDGSWSETGRTAWISGANGIGLSALPTLGGSSWTQANGINDAGWVVGTSLTAAGTERAFVIGPNGTSARELGTLGGSSSSATAINASGQVVGTSTTAAGVQRGFISDAQAGNLHELGSLYPGGTSTPTAVNASGQVTGMSNRAPLDATDRAFITGPNGAAMREIPGPYPGDFSRGLGINDRGQVVGLAAPGLRFPTGFIAEADGSSRTLEVPLPPAGGEFPVSVDVWPGGINAAGQVVGRYHQGTYAEGLFVTGPDGNGATLVDYGPFSPGPPGSALYWNYDAALLINDAGQILATSGDGHVYLISPVPEPAVVAMMLAGLGLLAFRHRRQLVRGLAALGASGALLAAAPLAQAVEYKLTDLGGFGGDWIGMVATGLNDSGQVVGYAYARGNNGWSSDDSYMAFVTGANGIGLTSIPTLGGSWNQATGINNQGWVVGTSSISGNNGDAPDDVRAFVMQGAGATPRSLGSSANSFASRINASGQVTGTFVNADGLQRGFVTTPGAGAIRPIGTLGGATSTASGINAAGTVAVSAENRVRGDATEPVRWRGALADASNQALTEVKVPGYDYNSIDTITTVSDINDRGQVLSGAARFYGPDGGVYLTEANGAVKRIGLEQLVTFQGQGREEFYAGGRAINNLGQIAGSYTFSPYLFSHAFITGPDGSNPVDVNSLSFVNADPSFNDLFLYASDINDRGQFVVTTLGSRAFLVTPVPEPAVVLMMACGLGWLFWRRREASLRA